MRTRSTSIYQTLAGAWPPIAGERLDAYLEKALREAKINTNWIEPDESWEAAVKAFARPTSTAVPTRSSRSPSVSPGSASGSRSRQTLLKLTCPGVPDIYQGDELWSLSLVDPDNRRPVDWQQSARLLAELQRGAKPTRETAKLYLVWKTLQLRAAHPAAFAGDYEPVDLGPGVCAYLRGDEILVAVPVRPGARVEVPDGFADVLDLEFGGRLLRRV